MNPCKKHIQRQPEVTIFGTISWIADELIGIRTLEQRLSEELESPCRRTISYLLTRIQDLDCRVDQLDRVLNEYALPKLPPRGIALAAERAQA